MIRSNHRKRSVDRPQDLPGVAGSLPFSSAKLSSSSGSSGQSQSNKQLKSCLRKKFPANTINTRIKSKMNALLSKVNDNNNEFKAKKRVSFAPGTVMVDRESKPYNRMLPKPRPPLMPDLFSGFGFDPDHQNLNLSSNNNSNQTVSYAQMAIKNANNNTTNSCNAPSNTNTSTTTTTTSSSSKFTNDYTKFTLAKKTPEHPMHTEMNRLPTRVKRLFENIENLQVAHVAYNSLPSTEVREKFLLDQVIRRQIVSLEISMSEGLIHFAMDVIDTMYEATHFIRSLFYEDFYHPDGSHTILPIIMNNNADDYINKLAPVVYSLNRISGDRRRSDNSSMSIETVCTKLQLEMISLTICPAKSLMFRSILEVVPSTAMRARQLLEEIECKSCIKWVNNSLMRKDYTKILLNLHLIDKSDIVTKFPATKKLSKKNCQHTRERKTTLPFRAAITSNPAEKGDISIP